MIIVCALEDEAQALGEKANLGDLSLTKQVERNPPHPVVSAHLVRSLSPSLSSSLRDLTEEPFFKFLLNFVEPNRRRPGF